MARLAVWSEVPSSPASLIGPILWGHIGPLCHALSLSLWTGSVRRLAVANGPNIFQMLLVFTMIYLSRITGLRTLPYTETPSNKRNIAILSD